MDAIEDWLVDQGLRAQDVALMLDGLCERLLAEGMPILRGHASLATLDPLYRARSHSWIRGRGVTSTVISHEQETDQFSISPFAMMERENLLRHYWLVDPDRPAGYPAIENVAALGATDYLAFLHPFLSEDFQALRGVGISFSADRPGGFDPAEQDRLFALSRLMASAIYRLTLRDIAVGLMDAYVGRPASRRILNGQVRRGYGEPIEAVLLMADLVGFTAVADSSGLDLIERLDEHLEAMSVPVVRRGGSVLKFMGDGVLAVFPVTEDVSKQAACRLALEAACEAIERNLSVNRARMAARPLPLDVALTYGEVFYGNVGAPGRLDFTVIGPAVNAVARIEALSEPLGRNLLISGDVAAELDAPLVSLGRHKLRGIERELEIFTPAERIGERGADQPAGTPILRQA